jgi:hypothetical protein
MRKRIKRTRKPRRFFPGSNLAFDEVEFLELEDWM